jgi:NAD kinase
MGFAFKECIALVTSTTRMQGLLKRWGSKSTAKFRMKSAKANFNENVRASTAEATVDTNCLDDEVDFVMIEREADAYEEAVGIVKQEIDVGLPISIVPREFLPDFYFAIARLVVVVGPDGLVANTAKYTNGLPIIGVNPDPTRVDGVLLPFRPKQVRSAVQRQMNGQAKSRSVTMARCIMNDGQELLAFNDFFIGCRSHASARYRITLDGLSENHSSSGIIVSTGAGSTGWLSSVFNMTQGILAQHATNSIQPMRMKWEDDRLVWVVREPFKSRQTQVKMVTGEITQGDLIVESLMSENGVIFSDGVESDAIEFNSGSIARFSIADCKAKLIVR